jgi:hypothetical protein
LTSVVISFAFSIPTYLPHRLRWIALSLTL